jgi:hypothetical protein
VILEIRNKYGVAAIGTKSVQITAGDTNGQVYTVPQNITLITQDANYRVLNVVLDKADYGLSSYTITLDLNSTARARIRNWATAPAWVDHFSYSVSPTFNSITIAGYKESGKLPAGSRNVSLGNISLTGISPGDASLALNASSIAQYGSSFVSLSGIPAQIHVYDVPALPGYSNRPGDLWPAGIHDGLIDDFDGNGVVNTADVTVFFNTWISGGFAGMPIVPFDYNHNYRIDTDDIVEYFNLIW